VRQRVKESAALYTLDMQALQALKPDLLVTQALCDVCAVAEEEVNAAACALPGQPAVLNLEPRTFSDVIRTIEQVAEATGTQRRAAQVIASLSQRVDAVAERSAKLTTRPRVVLLEWLDPLFSCGHWNPELVRIAGGVEGIGREGERSRTVEWSEIVEWQPEVMVIACCGLGVERALGDIPILEAQEGFAAVPCVANDRLYVVDGSSYFSRPGPRLVDSLEILADAIHGVRGVRGVRGETAQLPLSAIRR
jgi:iron complex transport system substrate-binding protein